MSEAVLVALIVGGLSFIGTVITNIVSSGKTQYRIEQLEKKMDKHNGLVERMTTVELKQASLSTHFDECMKSIKEKINELTA